MSNDPLDPLQYESSDQRALAQIRGNFAQQIQHGDFELPIEVHENFATPEQQHEWMKQYQAEVPEHDSEDLQPWTYIADYSVHSLTPKLTDETKGPFYIHARIRKDKKLQFGIFKEITLQKESKPTSLALAKIEEWRSSQLRHGEQIQPQLRIASKVESEAKLLKGAKLIKSACPRFVGILMNYGRAVVLLNTTVLRTKQTKSGKILESETLTARHYSHIDYYGHCWSYWAAIIDDVLYFVGIPIYKDEQAGSMVYTAKHTYVWVDGESSSSYEHVRAAVALPPTEDDLRFMHNQQIRHDMDFYSPPTHPFYFAMLEAFGVDSDWGTVTTERSFKLETWLKERLENESDTLILSRALATISPKEAHQLYRGDINARLSLLARNGGVVQRGNQLSIEQSPQYEASDGVERASDSYGRSGFVLNRHIDGLSCRETILAQAISASQHGCNYSISIVGGTRPYKYFNIENILGDIDVIIYYFAKKITIVEEDGSGGPDFGGGGGGDDPDPPPIPGEDPWYTNGYVAGGGITVKAQRRIIAGDRFIEWEFALDQTAIVLAREITVESSITVNANASFQGAHATVNMGIKNSSAESLELEFAGTDGDDTTTKTETHRKSFTPAWEGSFKLNVISVTSNSKALSSGKFITVSRTNAPTDSLHEASNWYKVELNKEAFKKQVKETLELNYRFEEIRETETMTSNGETLTATVTGNVLNYNISVS